MPRTNKGTSRRIVPIRIPTVLKNTSTEHDRYFVNQTRDYFDDVSFRELC